MRKVLRENSIFRGLQPRVKLPCWSLERACEAVIFSGKLSTPKLRLKFIRGDVVMDVKSILAKCKLRSEPNPMENMPYSLFWKSTRWEEKERARDFCPGIVATDEETTVRYVVIRDVERDTLGGMRFHMSA